MANIFEFTAENRNVAGRGGARGARRDGMVPAVIYGGKSEPRSIALVHYEVVKHLEHEAVYSHVLDLKIDGKTEKAILKDIQRHPAKPQILHMDFMRVDESQALRVHVPLHFINEDTCIGVKQGGVVTHSMVDVEVSCLPSKLPEYIEVDLANIDIGGSVHLSDVILPEGVGIVAMAQEGDHDYTVAQVMKTRVEKEEEVDDSADDSSSEEEPEDN